jgi:hypothetical protein
LTPGKAAPHLGRCALPCAPQPRLARQRGTGGDLGSAEGHRAESPSPRRMRSLPSCLRTRARSSDARGSPCGDPRQAYVTEFAFVSHHPDARVKPTRAPWSVDALERRLTMRLFTWIAAAGLALGAAGPVAAALRRRRAADGGTAVRRASLPDAAGALLADAVDRVEARGAHSAAVVAARPARAAAAVARAAGRSVVGARARAALAVAAAVEWRAAV